QPHLSCVGEWRRAGPGACSRYGELELWYPYFLPDGRHFLYFAVGPQEGQGLKPLGMYVGALDGTLRKLLMRGGSNSKYAAGYLTFLRESTLMAQPFDVKRLELTGAAVPIVEQVQLGGAAGVTGGFSLSETGG